MQTFQEVAKLFNHNFAKLAAGEEIITYQQIPSLEAGRVILSRASMAVRQRKSKVFYQGIETRQRLFQGMHDRGEEFIYADGEIVEADKQNIASHLPLHAKLISVKIKRIKANEIWDLTTHPDIWGFGAREELYVAVNVEKLILAPNAKVIIKGNVLSFSCQEIVREQIVGGESIIDFDIGILPTPTSVDTKHGQHDGIDGESVKDGINGADGQTPKVQTGMFGPTIISDADFEGQQHGIAGTAGEAGNRGNDGRIGGMVKQAEIFIGRLTNFEANSLKIFSKPGDGGNAGNGSNGGNAGNGGNGGDGIETVNQTIQPGRGGDAGNGGNGGRGGNGGNGGIASNMFVEVPPILISLITTISLPSEGGIAGKGGQGGEAGVAGIGGIQQNTLSAFKAPDGKVGENGKDGKDGKHGRERAGANIFVNGVLPKTIDLLSACENQQPSPSRVTNHSNTALIGKAAKAFMEWSKTGFAKVDKTVLKNRANACLDCPHRQAPQSTLQKLISFSLKKEGLKLGIEGSACALCGCDIAKKIQLPSEFCPDQHLEIAHNTRWGEPIRTK